MSDETLENAGVAQLVERQLPKLEHPPGWVEVRQDEPAEDYHADKRFLNSSTLADYLRSESLYFHTHLAKRLGQSESEALSRGSLIHTCLEIGREAASERIRVAPAEHCTATGLSRSVKSRDFFSQHPEVIWVTPSDGEFVGVVFDEIEKNVAVRDIYESGHIRECSIRYEKDGHYLKCRPDLVLFDGRIADWKTTRHVNPVAQFWTSVRDYAYHLSHAVYINGALAAGFSGEPMTYVLISTTSYAVEAVRLPQRAIDYGQRTLDRLLAEIQLRRETEDWTPSTYGQVHELFIPKHFYGEDE